MRCSHRLHSLRLTNEEMSQHAMAYLTPDSVLIKGARKRLVPIANAENAVPPPAVIKKYD